MDLAQVTEHLKALDQLVQNIGQRLRKLEQSVQEIKANSDDDSKVTDLQCDMDILKMDVERLKQDAGFYDKPEHSPIKN
ncbi:hypothetical protein [Haliscomenobacter sp.]|uniref:hypothetical protein n=1 Tax=Haliscomenobacter sp. TaxID=2717303 RepID=UPI003BA8B7E3